jgi:hypothetical protein
MTEGEIIQNLDRAKYERVLDLIRRATANGTHVDVAKAIARDWFPLCRIDAKGKIEIVCDGEIERKC